MVTGLVAPALAAQHPQLTILCSLGSQPFAVPRLSPLLCSLTDFHSVQTPVTAAEGLVVTGPLVAVMVQ